MHLNLFVNYLKEFLSIALDIREGEWRRVILMQLVFFLLISTLLIIKPAINALFLSDVGIENLPHAYILVAFAAGIITTFYSRVLNRYSLNKTIHKTLLFSVISISLFSVLLRLNILDTWILYLFYVWVAVFGVLATSQFWILANIVFNTREAKRLFSLIGGAAIAGGIFGGYLTSALAPAIGSENLLFVGVLFLAICIPLSKKIWNSNKATAVSVFRRKERMGRVSEHPLRLIANSKHLIYLAMITAVGVLVSKLVDYQFSAISSDAISDPDELASFFGFWFSTINIISLLIQLFITRRVVGMYGVGMSLFFLPIGIFIGAMAIFITPALWTAILIRTFDGSLKQSINKSAIELLALPIPSETKNQVKTFIDVFVDSFATGIGGLLLIMLINGFDLSLRFVSVLIVLLIFLWLYYAKKVRIEYLSLFKNKLNLKNDRVRNEKSSLDLNNLSVYEGLNKVLYHGSEEQILFVLKHTDDITHEKLLPALKHLINHREPTVVMEAIRKLYFYKKENLSETIRSFVHHQELGVRIAAIEYMIEHSDTDRSEIVKKYINDQNLEISYATLMALINEIRDNQDMKVAFNVEKIINRKISDIQREQSEENIQLKKVYLLKVIGSANIPGFYYFIHEALRSEDPAIVRSAIQAAGKSLDSEFIPELLECLWTKDFKINAIDALTGFGFKLIDYLKPIIKKENIQLEIVREIPLVIERIKTQSGVDFLFELLDYGDIVVRNAAIKSLTLIKITQSHLSFHNKRVAKYILDEAVLFENTLSAMYLQQERLRMDLNEKSNVEFEARKSLIELLERRLDDNLERIFKFLGLKYPPQEIDTVYKGLKSDKVEIRISAIDFLDNLLETNLKKILIPIIESSIAESVTEKTLKELNIKTLMSQSECFEILLGGKDLKVKLAVLYLIQVIGDPKYLSIVKVYEEHPNMKINTFAKKAIQAMAPSN